MLGNVINNTFILGNYFKINLFFKFYYQNNFKFDHQFYLIFIINYFYFVHFKNFIQYIFNQVYLIQFDIIDLNPY